jgi:hypothetical protein
MFKKLKHRHFSVHYLHLEVENPLSFTAYPSLTPEGASHCPDPEWTLGTAESSVDTVCWRETPKTHERYGGWTQCHTVGEAFLASKLCHALLHKWINSTSTMICKISPVLRKLTAWLINKGIFSKMILNEELLRW